MDTQSLDRLAWAGGAVPAGLGYDDTLYFLMIRALYDFHRGHPEIGTEAGRIEKQLIETTVRAYRADRDLARHIGKIMLATGAARAEYRKARKNFMANAAWMPPEFVSALAAADRIVEALDNIPIEEPEKNGMVRSTSDNGATPENPEACPPAQG